MICGVREGPLFCQEGVQKVALLRLDPLRSFPKPQARTCRFSATGTAEVDLPDPQARGRPLNELRPEEKHSRETGSRPPRQAQHEAACAHVTEAL